MSSAQCLKTICKVGKHDIKSMGSCGRYVWTGDKGGNVAVRHTETGEAVHSLRLGHGVFANTIVLSGDSMCIGCTDGRLRLYCTETFILKHTYDLNRTIGTDSVSSVIHYGTYLFAGCDSGQVYSIDSTGTIASICSSSSPITCLAAKPGVVYAGNETGHVASIPIASPQDIVIQKVHKQHITALVWSWKANTMWVGSGDGRIAVLNISDTNRLEPLATLTQHHTPNSPTDCSVTLIASGGYILSGGLHGDLAVWDAAERTFAPPAYGRVTCLPLSHSVRRLQSIHSTASKIWSYGTDRNTTLLELHGVSDEVSSILSSALRDAAVLGRKALGHENSFKEAVANVARLGEQLKAARSEVDMAEEAAAQCKKEKEELACEKSVLGKELAAANGRLDEVGKENQRLREEKAELETKLLKAEQTIREKEAALAEEAAKYNTLKLESEKKAKEIDSLTVKTKQLDQRLADKTKSVQSFTKQLQDSKDEVLRKEVQVKKMDSDKKDIEKNLQTQKQTTSKLENQVAMLEGNVKNLKDTLLVKTNEVTELTASRDSHRTKANRVSGDLETAIKVLETEVTEKRSVADAAVLARNEVELLRKERDELMNRATHERSFGIDSEGMVMRLKGQLSQLHEALEQERLNNKTLEDQYTIFQFVINSRGELVTAIWFLNDQVKRVRRDLKQLADFLRQKGVHDKEPVLLNALQDSLHLLEEKTAYIVANYFTEYEKLHLGISSYHYYPDTSRPQVVGDKLLSKLRQVTPSKQYRRGPSPTPARSVDPIIVDTTVPYSPMRTPLR
eukprot:TRINITY_DN29444_c0_g1_i1.p1 TRINITY_DN29444_c0_g1~~TRINITY_DN29444_c0_g1_i1.p1  ORF type:complete len:806 (+),score=314.08 TRINITY_DN29444_c0_g1_i1:43-2418(+)